LNTNTTQDEVNPCHSLLHGRLLILRKQFADSSDTVNLFVIRILTTNLWWDSTHIYTNIKRLWKHCSNIWLSYLERIFNRL